MHALTIRRVPTLHRLPQVYFANVLCSFRSSCQCLRPRLSGRIYRSLFVDRANGSSRPDKPCAALDCFCSKGTTGRLAVLSNHHPRSTLIAKGPVFTNASARFIYGHISSPRTLCPPLLRPPLRHRRIRRQRVPPLARPLCTVQIAIPKGLAVTLFRRRTVHRLFSKNHMPRILHDPPAGVVRQIGLQEPVPVADIIIHRPG